MKKKNKKNMMKNMVKKQEGSSITDIPEVYNVEPTVLFNNPIRLIDTAGFGDTRGEEFDDNITKDIQKSFEGETFEESDYKDKINKLNAIYIIFWAFDTRCHERDKNILDKIFSLFGEDIKENIIIIFTFADTFTNYPALTVLKNKDGTFFKILGNIKDISYFAFNNKDYFSNERDIFKITYHKNQINFGKLIKYTFSLRSITLEKTGEVLKDRE